MCIFPVARSVAHRAQSCRRDCARIIAVVRGYEDAYDLVHLRKDAAFKLACGRLPDTDRDLCSQPTLSRLENAPCLREAIRLSYVLIYDCSRRIAREGGG